MGKQLPTPPAMSESVTTTAKRLKLSETRVRELFDQGVLRGTRDAVGRRQITRASVDAEAKRRGEACD
jgi:hypothetical protein